ncbi:hypothetical protein AB0J38_38565 [Streptomyces sp. NPDC050095]|uniref:ATP-binding protein n=1 Tax=unclassified Streptomyces TaxID=2593676 RepID=UPI0034157765
MDSLPVETTRFIGRTSELAYLERELTEQRLLTLTGVGGVGKTRLARRAGAGVRAAFPDGVWLAGLSPLRDADALPLAVYEALRLADRSHRPAVDMVAEWLADKRLLLILDCCEHLADGCADFARLLLAAAPGLHILATSRCPLRVPGEHVVTVAPLPVSTAGGPADAVVLFRDRAASAVPRTVLAESDSAAIAEICAHLDGIPLAIELAAARLPELPLDHLRRLLHTRFEPLTAQGGDGHEPRHRTLRTTIGWSHELCTPLERLLWARLSVFAGGFDEEAVAAVCSGGPLGGDRAAGLLASLADKSVLQRQKTATGIRYAMLDTVREFGKEWLRGLDEEQSLAHRHRDHYRRLARTAHREWPGPRQVDWYHRVTVEYANLRAALESWLSDPDPLPALEMAGNLWPLWFCHGFQREGRHYLERAFARTSDRDHSPERFWALWACGLVAVAQGDRAAAAALDSACRAVADALGDPATAEAAASLTGAGLATSARPGDAVALLEPAMRSPGFGGDSPIARYMALCSVTVAHLNLGRFAELAVTADILREACERTGEQWCRAYALYCLANAALGTGDPVAALRHGSEALRIKWLLHDTLGAAMILETLSAALMATDPERAPWLLGIADSLWASFGRPQSGMPGLAAVRRGRERRLRDTLGAAAYAAAHRKGLETGIDDGIAEVLRLDHHR